MGTFSVSVPGALGTNKGPAADGVLLGQLTPTNPTKALLKSLFGSGLCYTDDGGVYVNETTPFNEATGDDVEILPATPAVNDAFYVGHASKKFARFDINQTTQGVGTWTIVWEYWNGSSWTALTGVTDGTTGFTAATGIVSVTFTEPTDWNQNTIDSNLGYWIRGRVSAYTAVTTPPQAGQGWIVFSAANALWIDDTTDFTDADAGDVDLLPTYPLVGDGFYIGYTEKFCKLKVTTSQARTGTATLALKYWNGTAWTALTVINDDSSGWSATAGTHLIHFVPPSDWVANTAANGPNAQTGFFVVMELTAKTSVTQQPIATQGWVYPMKTGASGMNAPEGGNVLEIEMQAQTKSGTASDSTFLFVNATKGTFGSFVWTKADPFVSASTNLSIVAGDDLVLVQVTEDGTTEFADASFAVRL